MDPETLAHLVTEDATPLVRTDFSDDAAWHAVVTALTAPVDGEPANIQPTDTRTLEGLTSETLVAILDDAPELRGYYLLADARSMTEAHDPDPTVAYVDLTVTEDDADEFGFVLGRSFRCAASHVATVETNLSIANVDFAEFADHADATGGVLRGFGQA